ncbi:DUF2357 domain-containing protein [Agrobacterium larrymoorei]|uniref:DUF2357 domain-containing protein n=1 Tax=Agrobacterium larrymoorei TaxID=160699 RepID=A0A4D7DP34_9HYPH|nr:DUF2357 domain-containing protein [Agrobacterium larrymoorei]QCI98845.1 DUF2357 domain-containing protein [Agrobacterium larrymoorei]QYA08267.1 DUF2357 domain-containing protein [Agrobacterium larrymoorei]
MILSFFNEKLDLVGSVTIVAKSDIVGLAPPLIVMSGAEAQALGEPPFQLLEGSSYEYVVQKVGLELKEIPTIIQKTRLKGELDRGTMATGLNVGTIHLTLIDQAGNELGTAAVEVRSRKLDYRVEYRDMMDDISRCAVDLIGTMASYAQGRREITLKGDPNTLQQRYFLLRGILQGRPFRQAVAQILESPHSKMSAVESIGDVRKGIKPTRTVLNQIAAARRRIKVPNGHALQDRGISSIPHEVATTVSVVSYDTPENQFVKRVLEILRATLSGIKHLYETIADLKSQQHLSVLSDMQSMTDWLDSVLNSDLMRRISRAGALSYSSPVLQRKVGYRELLRGWLAAQMASQLSWSGGELVFGAGQKNVATLYEYWCFLRVVEAVQQVAHLPADFAKGLIRQNGGGLEFTLARGKQADIIGVTEILGRRLKVKVSFNETFRQRAKYHNAGSWSREMRPDVTLTFWPSDLAPNDAEAVGLVSRIHFDAKYKSKVSSFRKDPDDNEDASVIYKRDDLAKMHAYRDAIRRSEAAYILYPGESGGDDSFEIYDEILPGLGAISLRPGDPRGLEILVAKIRLLAQNCSMQLSQREYLSYSQNYTKRIEPSLLNALLPDLSPTIIGETQAPSIRLDIQRIRHIFMCNINTAKDIRFDGATRVLSVPVRELVPEAFSIGLKDRLIFITEGTVKRLAYVDQVGLGVGEVRLSVSLYDSDALVALTDELTVRGSGASSDFWLISL